MKTRFCPTSIARRAEPDTVTGKDRQEPKPIRRDQWKKIANMLRVGGNLHDAAAIARISYGRLYRNIEADRHLSRDVQEIMAECKHHHLEKIYDGEKGWQASAWFLERMYRREYALQLHENTDEERAIQIRKIVRESGQRPKLEPSEN